MFNSEIKKKANKLRLIDKPRLDKNNFRSFNPMLENNAKSMP
jgi:hypothetical protein